MPLYTYINPKTKQTIDIVQSVHDEHAYIDKNGLQWNRVFTAPEVNTHGTLKAETSEKQFSEFTKNRKGTLGDLWDQSAELSDKRKKVYG
jgi:predicted nucleic acid-binding Zn ribbon protein